MVTEGTDSKTRWDWDPGKRDTRKSRVTSRVLARAAAEVVALVMSLTKVRVQGDKQEAGKEDGVLFI